VLQRAARAPALWLTTRTTAGPPRARRQPARRPPRKCPHPPRQRSRVRFPRPLAPACARPRVIRPAKTPRTYLPRDFSQPIGGSGLRSQDPSTAGPSETLGVWPLSAAVITRSTLGTPPPVPIEDPTACRSPLHQ
jgi:hypothetical protein